MENSETENSLKKLVKQLVKVNIMLTVAFLLIGAMGVKDLINMTKTTNKLSEVAQKTGVEFQTRTNSVLGVWKVVKPR